MRILKIFSLSGALLLSGCAAMRGTEPSASNPYVYTPNLWSHHQELNESVELCAVKAESILTALGFRHVIKNGTYVYGNFGHNRAAIKCVTAYGKTFVYTAVAGPEVRVVERLRNEIAWKL